MYSVFFIFHQTHIANDWLETELNINGSFELKISFIKEEC